MKKKIEIARTTTDIKFKVAVFPIVTLVRFGAVWVVWPVGLDLMAKWMMVVFNAGVGSG